MMVTAGAVSVFVGFQKVPIPELERVEQNKQEKQKKHQDPRELSSLLFPAGFRFQNSKELLETQPEPASLERVEQKTERK